MLNKPSVETNYLGIELCKNSKTHVWKKSARKTFPAHHHLSLIGRGLSATKSLAHGTKLAENQ
jgi:hypothetical protein